MNIVILSILAIIVLLQIYLLIQNYKIQKEQAQNKNNLDIEKLQKTIKEEFLISRQEKTNSDRSQRQELASSLKNFSESNSKVIKELSEAEKKQLDSFSQQLFSLTKMNEEKINHLGQMLDKRLQTFQEQLKISAAENRTELKQNLKELQEENSKKLEEIRGTVDEKLQSTLEKRISQSFKTVSEQLEKVYKGIGEMQNLASDVGDLKNVLSNVKTKGVLGEYQLANILEQLFSVDQYAKNVKTKEGSAAFVEFALKMPGKDNSSENIWLPIDAKFPSMVYENLFKAYESSQNELIEKYQKEMVMLIKRYAKEISDKYLDPPNTTDFALLFLPFEGLYAEVLRQPGLFETIQRDYKIIITGPTTLSAILNSLQMGFHTLAIEKRSSEVWRILAAVKTEFGKFGTILKKAQDKISNAGKDIDLLVGQRSRAIERRLRTVHELSADDEAIELLESE